jgi:hypothetical protein
MDDKVYITTCYLECFAMTPVCGLQEAANALATYESSIQALLKC